MKKIIIILLLLFTIAAQAQLKVNLGAERTDLNKGAITIDLSYFRSLDTLFGNQELFIPGKNSFFIVTPDIDIKAGTEDAFSSVILKASGLLTTFKTTTIAGLRAPDYNKTFHTFPLSLGVETNTRFNNTNGILELGWIPFYQSYGRPSPEWVKRTNFGLFLQGGYKFQSDTSGAGGQENQSEEQENKWIFRVHGSGGIDTDQLITIRGLGIGLVGTADGWGDVVNSAFYYKLEGRARVYLTPETFFDFVIQKGSGPPFFNDAMQAGVGVILNF